MRLNRAGGRAAAVEKNGYGRADGVLILGKPVDQLVASRLRMAWLAPGKFRPSVQQAIAINEYAHQCHPAKVLVPAGMEI